MEISSAELALLLLSRVAAQRVVAALAFLVWLQQAHLNAGRQSRPFFFSKKVPCEAIIQKSAAYAERALLTGDAGVSCGCVVLAFGFLSLTCPGLI